VAQRALIAIIVSYRDTLLGIYKDLFSLASPVSSYLTIVFLDVRQPVELSYFALHVRPFTVIDMCFHSGRREPPEAMV
jgi:hypothetical protein